MIRRAIPAVAAAVVWLLLAATVSHADGEITVSIVDVDDSEFPIVVAVVTADVDGRPVESLTSDQVQVDESGSPASVTSVTSAVDAGTPLALAIVVDTSGSMEGAPIEEARVAAGSLVQSLDPGDAAAIVSFADHVTILQELSSDQEALTNGVRQLAALGNTALYDAVAEASDIAGNSGFARRAVVFLSDGQEFGGLSERTRDEALQAVANGSSLFYVVGYGSSIDRPFLEQVAETSGGQFFLAEGLGDIASVYEDLQALLRSQLVVTVESSASAEDRQRQIEVNVSTDRGTGAAARGYQSQRAVAAAPTLTATPTAAVTTPVPTVVATPELAVENEGFPVTIALLVALIGGVAVLAAFLVRRRSGRPGPAVGVRALDARPIPRTMTAQPPPIIGRLELVGGSMAESTPVVQDRPVTIGSAATCELQLAMAPTVAPEHARVWLRDGRPMLHHLARNYETKVDGRTTEWASIADGETVEIGPFLIQYRQLDEPAEQLVNAREAGS